MTCEHLYPLEKALIDAGMEEVFRGAAWSNNCREWVYFNCVFTDLHKTIKRFNLDTHFVKIHSHPGTHDGQEHGLVCASCNDGIMGQHPEMVKRSFTHHEKFE